MSDSTHGRWSLSWFDLFAGDVLHAYPNWPAPVLIISDGAYGVRGFHGDTVGPESLADWYRPHVEAWSAAAAPSTTLWFWNTEIGWATVHPILQANGWDYVELITWDKGIAHIAGNVNGKTIRRFPVVTEVCVLYQRRMEIMSAEGPMSVQRWLRYEWQRAGIPLYKANEACSVRNAATRKYLTQDWLWYWPPGEMMEKLATYANEHGRPADGPYFSIDGEQVVTAKQWDSYRYVWNHRHGITNVWRRPPLHDDERLKGTLRRAAPRVYKPSSGSAAHLNQKPLEFMETIVKAASKEGDVVWEPFGGLASASVAAVALGRRAYVAETDPEFVKLARTRLMDAVAAADPAAESQEEQTLALRRAGYRSLDTLWYQGRMSGFEPGQARPAPVEPALDPNDPRTPLQARLRTALLALPSYFEFNNFISGVNATDLFSLNSLLGTSIENQVLKALNAERLLWDPDDEWVGCVFERQAQAFPDVRLIRKNATGKPEIILGIELKGWFMLAKEGEPSFRMAQTPAACADHDLLVVVPWYLDNVLSGKPVAAEPFVVSSRWATEYRNYYWQVTRKVQPGINVDITSPPGAHPYPTKDEHSLDVPVDDKGGNFGRLSRVPGLMSEWAAATNQLEILGVRNENWYRFLKLHTDKGDPDTISAVLVQRLGRHLDAEGAGKAAQIAQLLAQIAEIFA